MFRLFCVAASLLSTTIAVNAESYCDILYPCAIPAAYQDGPYLAKPVIRDLPFRALQGYCGVAHLAATGGALGCAVFRGNECHVFLPVEFKTKMPDFYAAVRNHELAHCRGWQHG